MVKKLKKINGELLLCEVNGTLELMPDLRGHHSSIIFKAKAKINDVVSIDEAHLFVATHRVIVKFSKVQNSAIATYYQHESVLSLSHYADSRFLLGLQSEKCLVIWDESNNSPIIKVREGCLVYSINRFLHTT